MDQLCAACGIPGGPDTAALLQTNAVLGDYAGTDTLQAAMAMLPMFGQSRLALALRAAGFGADGQGIVLAPPAFTAQYLPWSALFGHGAGAGQTALRQLPYLGRPAADPHPGRRGTMRPIFGIWPYPARRGAAGQPAAAGVCGPHPGGPRQHGAPRTLAGPALPRLLERGGAVADFGWDKQGLVLSVRRME